MFLKNGVFFIFKDVCIKKLKENKKQFKNVKNAKDSKFNGIISFFNIVEFFTLNCPNVKKIGISIFHLWQAMYHK